MVMYYSLFAHSRDPLITETASQHCGRSLFHAHASSVPHLLKNPHTKKSEKLVAGNKQYELGWDFNRSEAPLTVICTGQAARHTAKCREAGACA